MDKGSDFLESHKRLMDNIKEFRSDSSLSRRVEVDTVKGTITSIVTETTRARPEITVVADKHLNVGLSVKGCGSTIVTTHICTPIVSNKSSNVEISSNSGVETTVTIKTPQK